VINGFLNIKIRRKKCWFDQWKAFTSNHSEWRNPYIFM